ncbi:MAG: PAS domain S-box protein, partial [Chitinophagaceae bacterium]
VVLDRHMNYLYWNGACETASGLRRDEVLGRNILELAPAFYEGPTYLEFRRALKGETVLLGAGAEAEGAPAGRLLPVRAGDGSVACLLWIMPQPRVAAPAPGIAQEEPPPQH